MIDISIIVPVYNTEQYLAKCIESILNQTFSKFELLLIDDGSTDTSGRICDDYKRIDNRIRVIHKNNEGVSVARNVGLDCAAGQYITFCDSDDFYMPYWLDKLYESAIEYNACCVAGILNKQTKEYTLSINDDETIADYLIRGLLQKGKWEVWNHLYKSEIIKENRIEFCTECEGFGEDLSFNLQYALYCKKISFISEEGYCHTTRKDSIMGKNDSMIRLNALNEVSYSLYRRLINNSETRLLRYFPLIHYLVIDNQYKRIVAQGRIRDLKSEVLKVRKVNWLKQQVKLYISSSKEFKRYFCEDNWNLSVLKSHYLLHYNYNLLRLERKIKGIKL